MLTWAIACSLCTVFSRSLRPALAGIDDGREAGGVDRARDHGGRLAALGQHQRMEHQLGRGQRHFVAVVQRMPGAGREPLAADEGAVARMQVFDEIGGAAAPDARMAAADGLLGNADVFVGSERILRVAPDHRFVVQRKHGRLGRLRPHPFDIGADGAAGGGECRLRFHDGSLDRDRDFLRGDDRRMRDVVLVAHQQLQRVLAGRQLDHRFRLAGAEVQVIAVGRDFGCPRAASRYRSAGGGGRYP
jgi:hypothetical protein